MTGRADFHERCAELRAADAVARAQGQPALSEDGQRKQLSKYQALAAFKGWRLEPQTDGSFVVTRPRIDRMLDDVAAVRAFLEEIGAPT